MQIPIGLVNKIRTNLSQANQKDDNIEKDVESKQTQSTNSSEENDHDFKQDRKVALNAPIKSSMVDFKLVKYFEDFGDKPIEALEA